LKFLNHTLVLQFFHPPNLSKFVKNPITNLFMAPIHYKVNRFSKSARLVHLTSLVFILIHYNIFWVSFALDIVFFLTCFSTCSFMRWRLSLNLSIWNNNNSQFCCSIKVVVALINLIIILNTSSNSLFFFSSSKILVSSSVSSYKTKGSM
jgi:hypothetical protein